MPTITVKHPFNFRHGITVKAYQKGTQEVSQAVAEHAFSNGFADKPKAAVEPKVVVEQKK